MTPIPHLLRAQNGDSIIETAVVLPAFTLLLFGIFQFSLGLTSYLGSAYAIRAAARYAGVHSLTSLAPASSTDIQNLVKASPFVPSAAGTAINVSYLTYAGSAAGNYTGNFVSVQISYPQSISIPFYSNTFTISSLCYRFIVR